MLLRSQHRFEREVVRSGPTRGASFGGSETQNGVEEPQDDMECRSMPPMSEGMAAETPFSLIHVRCLLVGHRSQVLKLGVVGVWVMAHVYSKYLARA
jgi:hypothetical protein